jgi:cyclopropane fatty-acyl-phospholipid synthase-like methyltransferase
MEPGSATAKNHALYESFWQEVPDFVRYNPGARHRRRLVVQALADGRFESLLDVGCGSGELLATLARVHPEASTLAGADLAPSQVAKNQDRFPGVDFYALDIQKTSLERTFDRVVCCEVIEHLDDQRAAMAHLAAMVKTGGRLLITCPTGKMYETERHFGHVRHPTAAELVGHANAAGLRVVSTLNWGWPTYRLLKWATNVNADWALRSFGSGRYSHPAKAVSSALYWVNHLNLPDDSRGCQLVATFEKAT